MIGPDEGLKVGLSREGSSNPRSNQGSGRKFAPLCEVSVLIILPETMTLDKMLPGKPATSSESPFVFHEFFFLTSPCFLSSIMGGLTFVMSTAGPGR